MFLSENYVQYVCTVILYRFVLVVQVLLTVCFGCTALRRTMYSIYVQFCFSCTAARLLVGRDKQVPKEWGGRGHNDNNNNYNNNYNSNNTNKKTNNELNNFI